MQACLCAPQACMDHEESLAAGHAQQLLVNLLYSMSAAHMEAQAEAGEGADWAQVRKQGAEPSTCLFQESTRICILCYSRCAPGRMRKMVMMRDFGALPSQDSDL